MRRALAVLVLGWAAALHAEVPDWVRQAAGTAVAPQPASTSAVVLFDERFVALNGAQRTIRHRRVLKILTPAGRELAYGAASSDGDRKALSIRGWTIDAGGKERTLSPRSAREMSAATFELYSDARVKWLSAADAGVGSIVAFESEQPLHAYEEQMVWRFQESIPVALARFSISTTVPYETKWVRHARPAADAGPVWEVRDVPAIESESGMPDAAALSGWMGIAWGKSRSWSDIAGWFESLSWPRLAASPELAAKARELGDVRACARFAQQDVRYVAVEIGIGGYQPHAASEVFRNRFGDCKDKVTLLRAMLKERGVEAYSVLVHTTPGMVEPSFPTIAAFNHVITAIRVPRSEAAGMPATIDHPKLGTVVIFDPTSGTTPFGELPSYLQGGRGLLVTPEGGELLELPIAKPEANALRRVLRMTLDPDGSLHGTVEETRTGSVAATLRNALKSLGVSERVRFVENAIATHLGHHTLSDVRIEGLDEITAPVVTRYSIVATGYATRVAGLLLVRPRVLGTKSDTIAIPRTHPWETGGTSLHTDDVEIAMPRSFVVDELPKAVTLDAPHLRYASESTFSGGVLRYRRTYAMKSLLIPPGDAAAVNDAYRAIAADERASAVFR